MTILPVYQYARRFEPVYAEFLEDLLPRAQGAFSISRDRQVFALMPGMNQTVAAMRRRARIGDRTAITQGYMRPFSQQQVFIYTSYS